MVSHFTLRIGQQNFSAEQIRQLKSDTANFDYYSTSIIQFCHDWLCGQQTFVVHTSGSTGQPKPISLSRHQMKESARLTIRTLKLQEGSSALLCINAAYIGGKMMLVRAMEGNFTITVVEATADPLAGLPPNSPFDFVAMVPLQLEATLKNPHSKATLQRSGAVIIGGAPLSEKLRHDLRQVSAPLYSTYGMTETVSHIALQRLNGPEATDYFTALPKIRLSQDERGCLCIEGSVTGGERIVTNDVVRLLDEKRFTWLGRADNIINSGGVKIQLEKVERLAEQSLLEESGNTRPLFAWGIPDELLGQKLVLFVEGTPLSATTENGWMKHLAQKLVKYEQPKAIFYLEKFCRTPSGKIQKPASASLFSKA